MDFSRLKSLFDRGSITSTQASVWVRKPAFIVLLATMTSGAAIAGPVTKISALAPVYNSADVEITWTTAIQGGCTSSNVAITNGGAASHQKLVAFLLAAFAADNQVEVIFGGGCMSGMNWIQTIKLIK